MFHSNNQTTKYAEIRLTAGTHKGKIQWYAESVPRPWQQNAFGEVRTVVVNLPLDYEPLEGEYWLVRKINAVSGIQFAVGVRRLANPDGVPEEIAGGHELVVSETPENDSCLVRHRGRVAAVEEISVPNQKWLDVYFHDDFRHELVITVSGSKWPQHHGQKLRLHGFHRIRDRLHAYHGKRLVEIYRP